MRCLIIGGGRFLGAKLLEELAYAKHDVAFFDPAPPPARVADQVRHFAGEKGALDFFREDMRRFKPDVVAHLSASAPADVAAMIEAFRDVAAHFVVTSNTNVYLAHGRFRETEPGSAVAVPIAEEAPLRKKALREEDQGDKREVEAALIRARVPSTALRLAPMYGPRDYFRRFYPLMLRMIDERPHILLGADQADWKWTHAFVDDAAHAIALAVTHPGEQHRVFNVGERKTPTVKERLEHIGTVFGWEGKILSIPEPELPAYLRTPGDFAQDLEIDSALIRKELDYKEKADYYDGLAAAIEWYRDNPPPQMVGRKFNYSAEDELVAARKPG